MSHAAFLDAIRAEPDDMAHRLVYADWLEDHGDEARAEFIRLQGRRDGLHPMHPLVRRSLPREEELLAAHRAEWTAFVPQGVAARFHRGFAEEFVMTPEQLIKHGTKLAGSTPFLQLVLTGEQDLQAWSPLVVPLSRLRQLDLMGFGVRLPQGLQSPPVPGRLRTTREFFESLFQGGAFAGLERWSVQEGPPPWTWIDALFQNPPRRLVELRIKRGFQMRHLVLSPVLPRLRSLSLSHSALVIDSMRDLGSVELPLLEALDLSFNQLGVEGTFGLGSRMPSLRWLNLSRTGLGDEGAIALARSGLLSRLHGIDLSLCRIGEKGALALAEADAPSLLTLDLIYNDLGERAERILAERFGEACLLHR